MIYLLIPPLFLMQPLTANTHQGFLNPHWQSDLIGQ